MKFSYKDSLQALKALLITSVIIFLLFFVLPYSCSQSSAAKRVLTEQGYSNIEITGWRPFAASKDDCFSTGFRAKNPASNIVTGAVTSGIFKGYTVRLD